MGFRLGDHIVGGEIFNTTNYSVHGWVELRGREQPLVLQLTGNCSPDLAGWHFRFETRSLPERSPADDESGELNQLAIQQIGPTGTMTAARRVGGSGSSATGSHEHRKSGEVGASEPGQYLYLEWYSQNGRVLIELVDPILEFVEYQPLDGGPPDGDASGSSTPSEDSPGSATPSSCDEGEAVQFDEHTPFSDDDSDDDPYQLFPHDLQLQLDMEANGTDWNSEDDDDKPQMIREMELMDELIENSPGVPVNELFDGPLKCPLPDQLGDQQVEEALKALLAELALHGIALDVCEHFSPREAYRLLLETICPEERAYPELRHTQWVQHYSTSDYCEQCQADIEREHGQPPDGDDADPEDPDDDVEF